MNRKLFAFTLIELLVVIAIIGILSGLIVVAMGGVTQKATIAKAQVFSNSLKNSIVLNLVSEWKLDQIDIPNTNQTSDTWKSINPCTLSDSAGACDSNHCPKIQTNCIYGSCLGFNGSSQYLDCGIDSSLQISGTVTLEAWVKPTPPHLQAYGGVFDNIAGHTDSRLLIGDSGNTLAQVYINSTATNVSGPNVINGQWNLIVYTYNGTQEIIYVNGVSGLPSAKTGAINTGSTNLVVGWGYSSHSYYHFNGLIDNVRIYNASIPTSQIKEQYYAGLNNLLANGSIMKDEYAERMSNLTTARN